MKYFEEPIVKIDLFQIEDVISTSVGGPADSEAGEEDTFG